MGNIDEKLDTTLSVRIPASVKALAELGSRATGESVSRLVTDALLEHLSALVERTNASRDLARKQFHTAIQRRLAAQNAPSLVDGLKAALKEAALNETAALYNTQNPRDAGDAGD